MSPYNKNNNPNGNNRGRANANKWWEKRNPDFDWDKLYKDNPSVDFEGFFNKLPDRVKGGVEGDRSFKAYRDMIYKMLHSKETKNQIDQMLQSGDPNVTIPQIASTVSDQAVRAFQSGGQELPTKSLVGGSLVLGTELIEIGNSGGFFNVDQRNALPIIERATKAVIKNGIKQGYLDPVEVQNLMESEMDDSQRMAGLRAGRNVGVPGAADEGVAMEQFAGQKVKEARAADARANRRNAPIQAQGGLNGI